MTKRIKKKKSTWHKTSFFINILFFIYKLDTILKIILFQIKLRMKFVRNRICKKKKNPTSLCPQHHVGQA